MRLIRPVVILLLVLALRAQHGYTCCLIALTSVVVGGLRLRAAWLVQGLLLACVVPRTDSGHAFIVAVRVGARRYIPVEFPDSPGIHGDPCYGSGAAS